MRLEEWGEGYMMLLTPYLNTINYSLLTRHEATLQRRDPITAALTLQPPPAVTYRESERRGMRGEQEERGSFSLVYHFKKD